MWDVNGDISILAGKIKLPKLKEVRVKQHREIPSKYVLKSVKVSRESSGKPSIQTSLRESI